MRKTSLGLDLGTNSIGWCLYRTDGEKPVEIIDLGVRIFGTSPNGAGRDPKSGASLAVERRIARGMSRRRDRYIGRRGALLNELIERDLLPKAKPDNKRLEREDPYELRVRALDGKLDPHQIGRALFHLNQRRGFKSNRKAERKVADKETGKIAVATKALDEEMVRFDARTYAEYLLTREIEDGRPRSMRVRMRADADGYDFYPDRRHYEDEFQQIWEKQASYHPSLLTDEARDAIHRIIFYQRPLKEQQVGYCTFAGWNGVPADEQRLPKAHPLFQQRRLYEEVNQLRIVTPGEADVPLTLDQRDALILKLQDVQKATFKSLAKVIKLQPGQRFNKESENRSDLIGDEVRAVMSDKKRFANRWVHFSLEEQLAIIAQVQDEEDADILLAWLAEHYDLDEQTALAVANARLPEGYGRFGETATRKLLDALKEDVITYSEAAAVAGFHHSDFRTGEDFAELPYYGEVLARNIAPGKEEYGDANERQFGKITNPTVHIGMNQLRKLVNAIIRTHGRPDTIYIELARELKLNDKQKDEHKKRIKRDTDAAIKRSEFLESMGQRDTGGNRMLMRLWEELDPRDSLNRRCPYCGDQISAEMLMNGSADIDHIIPYSRCLDDGAGNKAVCHTHCNRQKSNKTPWERWGGTDRWEIIQDQVARMHKSKQWRFGPDAMDRVNLVDGVVQEDGFIARQLTDTQYLSRLAAQYLGSLYPEKGKRHVYAIPGRMTAMFRRLWRLNSLHLKDIRVESEHSDVPKNRLDHRHHTIDAAVVAALTPWMIQQVAHAAARAETQNLDKLFDGLASPWSGFRDELQERILAVTVSHKADHGRRGKADKHRDVTAGRLHNDTAYGLTGHMSASGLPIVVRRIALTSLKPEDLTNPDRFSDKDLQAALYSATQGATGKEFETALKAFSKREGPYQHIRRVRVREALNVIPIRDASGKAYKAYKGDANARMDIWRLPDGKWVSKWKDRDGVEHSGIVSMFDAHQHDKIAPKPHPAAKRVLSLQQNDLVAVERDGGSREIMRVVKFSNNGQIAFSEHNEAGALKARDSASNEIDPFKYFLSSASGLQKAKARQIRIDELGRILDPGPRS